MHAIEKPEDLNTSALELFGVLLKNTQNDEEVVDGRYSWVDVRDIAEAHVVALEKPEAGGERILFSAGKLPTSFEESTPHSPGNLGPAAWQDFSERFRMPSQIR